MSDAPAGRGRASPAPAVAPLVVLFLVNVLNFYDRQALGAVVEPLRREFHLSDTQLGALTTAFTVLYAVAGLSLGRLADSWSRRKLLAIGTAVWAALTGLGGLAASYAFLMATRLGVGIGEAVCAPAATSWIGDLVPPHRRARAMAFFMMAVPIGGMLSFAVTGPVAQAHGWRVALAVAALPAAALVPALLWLKEAGGRGPRGGEREPASPRTLLRLPSFWWIVASGAILNFALYSFSTFLPAFLTRFHGLSVAKAGLWSGIGSGAAGILGALAAAAFGDLRLRGADPLVRGRPAPESEERVPGDPRGPGGPPLESPAPAARRLRFAAAAALAAAPLAWLAIRQPAGAAVVAIPLIMAAYGLLQTYYGLVYAAIQDIVAPGLRGAAMGTYFMAMYLCGASFGPLVTGSLSDRFARAAAGSGAITEAARALGLRQAMYVIPALSFVLAGALWAGARAARGARQPE